MSNRRTGPSRKFARIDLTLLTGSPILEGDESEYFVSGADKVSVHWETEWKRVGLHIAPCMPAICKVRWLSMEDKVPSGRGEFKPMEIPPVTFEVGSSLRKLGEEVTF